MGPAPFLPMPAAELCDRPVTVEQVWGRPAIAELRDRLATADGPHEMLTLLEEELMRRLCETAGLGLVRHTSSVIAETSGAVAIGDLSVAAGVSSTHLAQRFKELIGVTPKRLARTYRFAAYDYTRAYWDQIGVTIVGRHVFDLNGWDGKPPSGIDHVVVVTHRPMPGGWDPEAPFHFVDGVEAAVAKAQELAGDRLIEVAAGDVGGKVLAAGLIDEVRMDVVPVVFGSGKRYCGSVHAQHLLEDPDVAIQGNRVLHLRYRVRR
ncbi:hypothetical protein [Microbispora sp. NBC_01389]|uniref:hypothetical protein n=1 Tax=Microbispora sp. NBC_01389 TaxID=2903584 RepID=UPI00324F4931